MESQKNVSDKEKTKLRNKIHSQKSRVKQKMASAGADLIITRMRQEFEDLADIIFSEMGDKS